jgi:glycosyltransferase involved in cell wall biosynthesis
MQPLIPKRIIQTGKRVEQPLRTRAMISNLKLRHPDYEYLFFDDSGVENFIDGEFPQYRTIFDSFRYRIQRYDFFRYLAVYRYGGFYFDLDVLLAANIDDLLKSSCVFPFEGLTYSHYLRSQYHMDWEIGNFAFGAAAGHPFLGAVIENCVRAQRDPSWVKPMMRKLPALSKSEFYVLNTTGPGLLSRTLAENPEISKSVHVLFPDDVLDFGNWNRFGELGAHLMEGSWRIKTGRIRRKLALDLEAGKMRNLVKQSAALGKTRQHPPRTEAWAEGSLPSAPVTSKPLVSILIPAYNSAEWIGDCIRSAMAQTWTNKEIIVVDDGSTDRTAAVARQFESYGVRVVSQENQGAAAARNTAYSLSKGDYIQWLDADDLLAPNKVALQMAEAEKSGNKRKLFSSAWGKFMYRPWQAQFTPTALWCDLNAVEWLQRKLELNIYMQTATWLVSRELTEAAGQWDTRLNTDDDGEYFCRVLMASDGVQFVRDSKVYYRSFGYNSLGYIGMSAGKCEAQWLSMQMHIAYLRSLDDSDRSRSVCVQYLRNCLLFFYPERLEIIRQAESMAEQLAGPLGKPSLSWKYNWAKSTFGWGPAKRMQVSLRKIRWQMTKSMDKMVFRIETQIGSEDIERWLSKAGAAH